MSKLSEALSAFISVCKDEGVDPTLQTVRRVHAGRRVQPRRRDNKDLMDNVVAAMLDEAVE